MDIETVLSGANTTYLLQLLEQYKVDPESVNADWHPILEELSSGFGALEEKPSWGMTLSVSDTPSSTASKQETKITSQRDLLDSARALSLIQAYRTNGHLMATLNPLNSAAPDLPKELNPKSYGFSDKDYNHPIYVNKIFGQDFMTLTELIGKLQKTYAQHITFEVMHIQDVDQREWLLNKIENEPFKLPTEKQKWILNHLTKAELFERFLHVKFPGAKRFGLDGGESLIPALHYIIEKKAKSGVQDIVFGMPHRGRLSTLCNVIQKPMRNIFSQFEGMSALPSNMDVSGDVKYHLGYSSDMMIDQQKVHLSLMANPSHLEAVNPLVLGKVRAKQDALKDLERTKVLGLIMHGDAAFAGQGIVFESLSFGKLKGYETGGTFHIIVNNQIGFTTLPTDSRSVPYSTDTAKFIQSPIFHVNADNPEAVIRVIDIACAYHDAFKQDVVIDLVCYRRFGHNEGDEPFFTQPSMYQTIQTHPSTRKLYEEVLLAKGIITKEEAQTIRDNVDYQLKQEYDAVQKVKGTQTSMRTHADWLDNKWKDIVPCVHEKDFLKPVKTGVDIAILRALGLKCHTPIQDFDLNSKIQRQWEAKRETLNKAEGIDWALAESMAFATLLMNGHSVRLSGQDCERGTFSHRHAVVTDQTTEKKYTPLNHIQQGQGHFTVINSPLSEYGVLGYEYGYSLEDPKNLILWEAQFGDFSNGAQTIIDQFISSSEEKWLRLSGLVLLLPHGLEGQGPEHSSARLERYLQLCAQNNMVVANCSTPANYFHILRRQMASPYRKPLVLMTPKSLLRHKHCVSSLKEMATGTTFLPIIEDHLPKNAVKRIVLCSGKVYYDLLEKRPDDVAIVHLEQFYPFPAEDLFNILSQYPKVPVIWCQEEPQNMGAWHFLDRRLEKVLTKWQGELARPIYVGRHASASPAVGSAYRHKTEQDQLIQEALF